MNMRNLLFLIVLFLVWLMGYYYYTPKKFPSLSTTQQQEQEFIGQPTDWLDEQEEVPSPELINNVVVSDNGITANPPLIQEQQEPVYTTRPREHTKQKSKKNKSKREMKKQASIQKTADTKQAVHAQQLPTPTITSELPMQQSETHDDIKNMIPAISGLVKKDIGYYKMLSWHYPHFFELMVNDQPLFSKQDKKITQSEPILIPADQPFVVRYNYEWHTPWGKKIGAKKVTFKAQKNVPQLTVHFKSNWKDEERIIVDGATKVSAELLEE